MPNKWKHHIAIFICLCFIFISFFSLAFIVVEANHDCTGEHCSICSCIHTAEQTLKQLGSGVMSTVVMIPTLGIILAALFSMLPILPCSTPVSQKIRIND